MQKLTPAQLHFLRDLAANGKSSRPGGYPTAGRDASNWLRTVDVLVRLGLVTAYQTVELQVTVTKTRDGYRTSRCWLPQTRHSPQSVTLALPAPAFVYETSSQGQTK